MSSSYISNKDKVLAKIKEVEKKALATVGAFVEAEAKLRTPVLSGTLKRSITNQVDEESNSVQIGTNTEYAIHVEKGTSSSTAQPYLEPAVDENISKINTIIEDALKKIS